MTMLTEAAESKMRVVSAEGLVEVEKAVTSETKKVVTPRRASASASPASASAMSTTIVVYARCTVIPLLLSTSRLASARFAWGTGQSNPQ